MAYTRLGAYLFDWEPFRRASYPARNLLLACYASAPAKQHLPGLIYASVQLLADSARMGYVEVQESLRELIDHGTLEHDAQRRVVRLTELPDKGERPANPKVLWMFWNRWRDLPESPLKYTHIDLLLWLAEPDRTPKLQETWDVTFGTISGNPTVSDHTKHYVGSTTIAKNVDNLRISPQRSLFANESSEADTVSGYGIETVGCTVYGNGKKRVGGAGGREENRKPAHRPPGRPPPGLPPEQPFTVQDLLGAVTELACGRIAADILDPRIGEELWRLVEICAQADVTLADIRLAGEFIGAGYIAYREDLDTRWLARSGSLLDVVSKARSWRDAGKPTPGSGGRSRRGKGPSASDLAEKARKLEAQGQ